MRAAIYWAPAVDDALWRAGCAWLGRDAETGAALVARDVAGFSGLTADARRYGFHATLRPPMRLATGWDEFLAAARGVADGCAAFALPALQVSLIDGFLALTLAAPCAEMQALAEAAVRATDRHRLQPDAAELARRRGAGLDAVGEALLAAHGYPYVCERWCFHMTLTRRLAVGEQDGVMAAARAHFAGVLAGPRWVRDLAVFTEAAPGADLLVAERFALATRA